MPKSRQRKAAIRARRTRLSGIAPRPRAAAIRTSRYGSSRSSVTSTSPTSARRSPGIRALSANRPGIPVVFHCKDRGAADLRVGVRSCGNVQHAKCVVLRGAAALHDPVDGPPARIGIRIVQYDLVVLLRGVVPQALAEGGTRCVGIRTTDRQQHEDAGRAAHPYGREPRSPRLRRRAPPSARAPAREQRTAPASSRRHP